MNRDKERLEVSLIGRLFSLEALLALMGLLSLISGAITGDLVRLTIGLLIFAVIALMLVRRHRRTKCKNPGTPHD